MIRVITGGEQGCSRGPSCSRRRSRCEKGAHRIDRQECLSAPAKTCVHKPTRARRRSLVHSIFNSADFDRGQSRRVYPQLRKWRESFARSRGAKSWLQIRSLQGSHGSPVPKPLAVDKALGATAVLRWAFCASPSPYEIGSSQILRSSVPTHL